MNRTDVARDRGQWRTLVNTVINTAKFLSSCTTGSFSRRAQLHGVSGNVWIFLKDVKWIRGDTIYYLRYTTEMYLASQSVYSVL
jgi:hypothetical protein